MDEEIFNNMLIQDLLHNEFLELPWSLKEIKLSIDFLNLKY